jgi:hypothetical protein
MEWKHPSSPVHKKFKQQPSFKKPVLTFFWHMQGPILVKFQVHGETVSSAKYSALLQDQLKPEIRHSVDYCPKGCYCCMAAYINSNGTDCATAWI